MELKMYQVDAFAKEVFTGNPAAICPLETWLPDQTMKKIAAENNLSETAFFVPQDSGFHIRWFTPAAEVELCGHATLATAFVLFNLEGYEGETIEFHSLSGKLTVTKKGDTLVLNFPVDDFKPVELTPELADSFDRLPIESYKGRTKHLLVFEDEKDIREIQPDFAHIAKYAIHGIIVTAKSQSEEIDFVSRFFAPGLGVNEDPVCGSAHTALIPYWADKLKKTKLSAVTLSERMGQLDCEYLGDRVNIGGLGKLFLEGTIHVS